MKSRNQTVERHERLETPLREQPRRVIAALADDEPLDATPILYDDESLSAEAYVTLVYEFHHVVLPDLAAAGLVRFDRLEDEVRSGERLEAVHSAF